MIIGDDSHVMTIINGKFLVISTTQVEESKSMVFPTLEPKDRKPRGAITQVSSSFAIERVPPIDMIVVQWQEDSWSIKCIAYELIVRSMGIISRLCSYQLPSYVDAKSKRSRDTVYIPAIWAQGRYLYS